ncbi:MAG: GTPase HflX [Chloroflexi bacterium]|nr:GTPase HflX [Chloroflexota bacterium]
MQIAKKEILTTAEPRERAVLVGVETPAGRGRWRMEDSLAELGELARTAGAEVVEAVAQRLARPTPSFYIGKGKLEELTALRHEVDANVVFFDDELSPVQQRNLENALGVKVLDRTALILDIFAKRAQTHEGRLQVELAQNEYLLPRLAGQWSHLERLGGGIGTRGPGETQLETDRRQVRRKIQKLRGELEEVRRHRALHRAHRRAQGVPVVALVGYTNAGKSTLFNSLCQADAHVEDKLFATLDPTTRRVLLSNGQFALLTDTVGFIQKLPHTVVAAFRATLEELSEAAVLLHVIDITNHNAAEQAQTVDDTLAELGLADKPVVTALNKVDLALPEAADDREAALALVPFAETLRERESVAMVSAAKQWGLPRLLSLLAEALDRVEVDRQRSYRAPA